MSASLEVPAARGGLPPDPVAPDSLPFLKRLQTLPARWQGEGFGAFAAEARLEKDGVRARAVWRVFKLEVRNRTIGRRYFKT